MLLSNRTEPCDDNPSGFASRPYPVFLREESYAIPFPSDRRKHRMDVSIQ